MFCQGELFPSFVCTFVHSTKLPLGPHGVFHHGGYVIPLSSPRVDGLSITRFRDEEDSFSFIETVLKVV